MSVIHLWLQLRTSWQLYGFCQIPVDFRWFQAYRFVPIYCRDLHQKHLIPEQSLRGLFTSNTNWSRWKGTADLMWVQHGGKWKCSLKFPLNASLGLRPEPSDTHCLRLACAQILPVPSCQGWVWDLWTVGETPEQGRVPQEHVPCSREFSLGKRGPLGDGGCVLGVCWSCFGC